MLVLNYIINVLHMVCNIGYLHLKKFKIDGLTGCAVVLSYNLIIVLVLGHCG